MTRNRRLTNWTWAVFLTLSPVCAAPALAAKMADESESPALRKPLPALAAPVAGEDDAAVFNTEAPPPPPFDPNYQPPAPMKEDPP